MASPNLRRDARVPAKIPVVLFKGRTEIPLETTDVSYRGLFVATDATEARDSRRATPSVRALVKLRVELPTGGFTAHAMVVHVAEGDRSGMGLQFWALGGTERKIWEELVRSMLEAQRTATARVRIVTPPAPFAARADGPASGIRSVATPAATPVPPPVEVVNETRQRGTRR